MHLDISRTAFFKTNEIYASQIPYLEVCSNVYIGSCILHFFIPLYREVFGVL